jgi:hypothetical protein
MQRRWEKVRVDRWGRWLLLLHWHSRWRRTKKSRNTRSDEINGGCESSIPTGMGRIIRKILIGWGWRWIRLLLRRRLLLVFLMLLAISLVLSS